jgi:hypothetical protein
MLTELKENVIRKKRRARRVSHACNPSYLENRDQEDLDLRPSWTKS